MDTLIYEVKQHIKTRLEAMHIRTRRSFIKLHLHLPLLVLLEATQELASVRERNFAYTHTVVFSCCSVMN